MLERIREGSQGIIAKVIIGLVILTFALAGVGGYLTASGDEPAATVNGQEIPLSSLERAYQNERARMESQFGAAFSELASDATYLKNFRQGILDRLIADELLSQTAENLGLRVSDAQIRRSIVEMPEFQLDGKFNNDRYLALLRQSGFQPNGFVDYMRKEMTRQQVVQAVLGSEFSLKNEANQAFELQQQTRDLRFVEVAANKFVEGIAPGEQQMKDYYQQNLSNYDTQEQVSVDYVRLTLDKLTDIAQVSEQEVQQYYDNNQGQYKTEEERRASHILIEFGDDEAAAQQQAEDILAKVKSGSDFAELATEFSADSFSAENGGDLEWFNRGVMDPAFDDAAFSLGAVGDTSELVKTSFGYHIIKLTDVKPEVIVSLDEVKEEITAAAKKDKANTEFFNLQQRMNELAFEIPDSLEDVAAETDQEVRTSGLFARGTAPQVLSNTKVINAAFSSELINDGVNSEVIEISPEEAIVLRVVKHQPVRTKQFEEVSAGIEAALVAELSQQKAKQWAQELVDKLAQEQDINSELTSHELSWQDKGQVTRFAADLAASVREQAFKMAEQGVEVVEMANGNVALLELVKVNLPDSSDEAQLASLERRLAANHGQQLYADFVEALKADAKIEIVTR